MKPAKATVAAVLMLALVAGPASLASAQTGQTGSTGSVQQAQPAQDPTSPDSLGRIRDAISREPTFRIENGQLRIYVEVIADWPNFAQANKGYDFINGPTGKGADPMSHQEFLGMVTPQDMYSSAGIKPGEIATMAVVNYVGQWAIAKGLNKLASYRKDKQMRDIKANIDAELAAIKK
jgi:hypothetical protein